MKSSAKIVEQIRKALADPESVKYDALKAIAKEYGEACNRLNLSLTKAVVYYSTGNYSEAARILKEGNLLSEYQTLLFPELEAWRDVCQMFGWEYTAYVSTVNGEKLKKFLMTQRPNAGISVQNHRLGPSPFNPNDIIFYVDPSARNTMEDNRISDASSSHSSIQFDSFDPDDDAFFSDAAVIGAESESHIPEEVSPHFYLPPIHSKPWFIWSVLWIVIGIVVLAFFALVFRLLTGNKDAENTDLISSQTVVAKNVYPSGKDTEKEEIADISENPVSNVIVPPEKGSEKVVNSELAANEEVKDRGEQALGDEVEVETKEEDILPEEEPIQSSTNPNIVKLENQWKQLKEERDFDNIVSFIVALRDEVEYLNSKLFICKTFLLNCKEHRSEELNSIMRLYDDFSKALENAEELVSGFDIESYQKKCEIVIEGIDCIDTLYHDDRHSENFEYKRIMSNVLLRKLFKGDGDSSGLVGENSLSDRFESVRDSISSFLLHSRTKEFSEDLGEIEVFVSKSSEIELKLEREILGFVVQTVNSENSFSTFPKSYKPKIFVNFDGELLDVYPWHTLGDNKTTDFGKGMEAYVNYCMNSQSKWGCNLYFAFNKTDEIDAQERIIEIVPREKGAGSFSITVGGTPVLLGVNMRTDKGHEGSLVFYISDPSCIPAILRSARVCLSFTPMAAPEEESVRSNFCQLHKPIDMTKISNVESDEFLTSGSFISESDFKILDNSDKNANVNNQTTSASHNVLFVVACDKEVKVKDENGSYLLKLGVIDSLEMNSAGETETDAGRRILFQFSRQTDNLLGNEGVTVVYKRLYAHSLFNTLRRLSSYYEGGWSLVDEKASSPDTFDVVVDRDFVNETLDRWQKEFGTGNLLFYLVRPGEETPRENWILYGKAPYKVFEEP